MYRHNGSFNNIIGTTELVGVLSECTHTNSGQQFIHMRKLTNASVYSH